MGAVLEDLYDHEGFAARRLADGTLTGELDDRRRPASTSSRRRL